MPQFELDDETYARVRLAARVAGISPDEVVRRALDALIAEEDQAAPTARDPWEPIELYAEYEGRRIDAKYLPATRRLTITSEPLAGQTFKTPSGAARAVVAALNPSRGATQTNGWHFWRVAATHDRLAALR